MLITELNLSNFLSFGPNTQNLQLGPLNVLIGPNSSGKSNLLESIEILKNAPWYLTQLVNRGGGVREWLWKGGQEIPNATLSAVITYPRGPQSLRYTVSFTEVRQRFEIVDEKIENEKPDNGSAKPHFYYRFNRGQPELNIRGEHRALPEEDIDFQKSILALRRDPDQYPEITYLGKIFGKIELYRDWNFGHDAASRSPQKADLPNSQLQPDIRNLGLVLNRLRRDPVVKARLLRALCALYDGIDDYDVQVEGGTVQVFFHEGQLMIPAPRLSDGTLRYLCLLVILCHPEPPPLICIEEPELGLHPDILPTLAELLKEASARCQIIVTTHSDILVDAMTDTPEAVVVCERSIEGTVLQRLSPERLKPWLESYRLGELWTRGEIGGTRW